MRSSSSKEPSFASEKDTDKKFARNYIISVSHGFKELEINAEYSLDQAIKDADSLMYEEKSRIKQTLNVIR